MEQDFFKNNEKFSGISPEKLEFLMKFASQNNAKQEGISFTPNETDLIIEILKQNMSPEEQRKADQILMLMRGMRKR